jgi:ATP-dependent exoDNAse (exonuclease V) beta subunit
LNSEILWCKPEESPFNQFSLLPVKYSSALSDTYFDKEYRAERFRVYVDHLNLMYVAFTRAMENLFIFAPLPSRDKLSNAADMLNKVLTEKAGQPGFESDDNGVKWVSGELFSSEGTDATREREQLLISHLISHEFAGKLRLQYRGTSFFDTRAEERIHQGNLMHELFSRIRSFDDINRALEAIIREGMIETSDAEKLKEEIVRLIGNKDVKNWFDGSWKVIAEQDILTPSGTIKRPDRVMLKDDRVIVVDYKFGRQQSASHRSQVRKYMKILEEMKYGEVKGFIWYVNLEVVLAV